MGRWQSAVAARLSVPLLQYYTILSAGMITTSGHLRELEPTIVLRPEDSAGLATGEIRKAFPPICPAKRYYSRQRSLNRCGDAQQLPIPIRPPAAARTSVGYDRTTRHRSSVRQRDKRRRGQPHHCEDRAPRHHRKDHVRQHHLVDREHPLAFMSTRARVPPSRDVGDVREDVP
jgi:hypothetical protein